VNMFCKNICELSNLRFQKKEFTYIRDCRFKLESSLRDTEELQSLDLVGFGVVPF